ncbi:sigma-70 family RNA polymerase sigma factor [Pyxidicoccus parkwayensis]|jgi:RNA polymerase sigma-70 factor, ECF subfamily|uniref:Sigma-70 family RNA polymerase sigma factor n=1 Tax=Pyxidicoccus parkwayensis TaxID=2813578 RepID=A0ABX7P456_9BACT|nr:sigma-70 family RNA polymerase sigma factor [Pyxidicoccus parkwaysis]QSQ25211.1 sigma-70 family RNA polymerase sigma factor [Pyxidicoccus parkwaysis]
MARGLSASELKAIYEIYAPTVHRRARTLLGRDSDAWDAVQEVFCRLMESGAAFRAEARPMTYIYRVTTNVSLNLLRSRALRDVAAGEAPPPDEAAAEPGEVEARNLLRALARELDERALQIATLHFMDFLTQEEIVEVVGLSRKTVGKVLEQVRTRARELAVEPKHGVVS